MPTENFRLGAIPRPDLFRMLSLVLVLPLALFSQTRQERPAPRTLDTVAFTTPEQFGAKCDGVADDHDTLQSAIDAIAGTGRVLLLPPGECLSSSTLNITGSITILGSAGRHGSYISFQSGGFVQRQFIWDVIYWNMGVRVDRGAGPAFTLNHGGWTLSNVSIINRNGTQPAIYAPQGSIENVIENFDINAPAAYSQPQIKLIDPDGGSLNNTIIRKGMILGNATLTTAPMIHLEGTSGETNNVIENVVFEGPTSGAIALYSISNSTVRNVWLGDLPATPVAPGILIAKSSQPQATSSAQILLQNIEYNAGTPTNPSVRCECNVAGQGQITIQSSHLAYVDNRGPNANQFFVIGQVGSTTFLGDPPLAQLNAAGQIAPNTLPVANNYGALAGSHWRQDASGNLVADRDAAYSIGSSTANRPANIYVSGTVVAGQLTVRLSTPGSSSDVCRPGSIWADDNFLYVCTASGSIRRASVDPF